MTEKKTEKATDPLTTVAEALLEIGETLESILALMQEREAGFKARKSSFDGAPRRSYGSRDSGDSEGGGSYERKPYRSAGSDGPPRRAYGDKPAYGDKKPYERKTYGDKPAYGDKKSFGDKKPYAPRGRSGGDDKPAPRKKYKDGY